MAGGAGDLGIGSLKAGAGWPKGGGLLGDAAGGAPLGPARGPGRRAGPPGRLLEVDVVGPSIRILRVGRPTGLTFTAGQYVKVGAPGTRRGSFSIASAPHDVHLELCIEHIPDGRLTPVLFGLGPGAQLDVGDRAKGSFLLDTKASTHLMVGTSTGMAPLRSMVRDAVHRGVAGTFVVLHGASHQDELPYADELGALAADGHDVRYVPTVSRPAHGRNAGWAGRTGRVDALAVEEASALDPATTAVYACGNTGMIAAVRNALRPKGFRVHAEAFD